MFDIAYSTGDWDRCLRVLDDLESHHGLSLWSISRRITVSKRTASTSDDDYASTLIASAKNGSVVSWLVYMMSYRADPNVTSATYLRNVERSLENSRLPNNIDKFLRYHAFSLNPRDAEDAASIIAVSETAPVIDRYIAVIDVLQFLSCKFSIGSTERMAAIDCIRQLVDKITDDRLVLLDETSSPDRSDGLLSRVRSTPADLYTIGDYQEAVTALLEIVKNAPECTSQYSLLARALIRMDASPELPPRVGDIVRTMAAVQTFASEDGPGTVDLLREALSGAHRLLSASIRCMFSGLGEDPSTSTFDASIEALNGAILSPLQLRCMPVEDQTMLLARAREKFPLSISIELQAAVLEFGSNELHDSLRVRLPTDRGDLYAARALLRMSRLPEATELLAKLETSSVVPVANDARRELYRAFMAAGDHRQALRLVARAHYQNERLHGIFQLEPLLNAIERSGNGSLYDEISLSICYHVENRFGGAKRLSIQADTAEEYVFSQNVQLPSQLETGNLNTERELLTLFLDQVCTPVVLDKFMALESVSQVEIERLGICRILSEIDPVNRQQYLDEIREITRRRVVRERFEQVKRTKIYVDTDGVKRQAEKILRDSFQRFAATLSEDTNSSERLEMVRRVQELLADVQTDGVKIHFRDLPANEGELIFDRLVKELMGLLVSSQEYGLEAYLSTRVRHGTMGNQLRSAFELQSLLTQRDNGQYQPDSYWPDSLGLENSDTGDWLAGRLAKFSEGLDNIIENLVRQRVQVRSESAPDGLFVFQTFNYDVVRLQAEITSETSFETFMDKVVEQFWTVLEITLGYVRRYIEEEFMASVHALTDELEKDAVREITWVNVSPLRDAIAAARTQMSVNVANVANWFTLARDMERPDYEFGIAVEVATESIRVCHPSLNITLHRPDNVSFDCRGKTLESLVYMLFTALDNALEHCGFHDHAPSLSLDTSLQDNWLELRLVNSCAPIASVNDSNDRLERLRSRIESGNEAQGLATIEGGSGYAKIIRILRHDLLSRHELTFGYRSDTEYAVTIGMEAKAIVK